MAYLEELSIDNNPLLVKEYTGGTGIEVTPDGVINATGGQQTSWDNITGKPTFAEVATSGSYNDLLNKPVIPSAYDDTQVRNDISALQSGKQDKLTAGENISISGNTISATDTTYSAGAGIDISGANQISAERNASNTYTKSEVDDLLPTSVSELTNDVNYQTHTQVMNLISTELANFERWDYKIVTALPATGEHGVRYLIKNAGNSYEEWIYVEGQYYDIGSTQPTGPIVIPVDPSPEPTALGAIWITT